MAKKQPKETGDKAAYDKVRDMLLKADDWDPPFTGDVSVAEHRDGMSGHWLLVRHGAKGERLSAFKGNHIGMRGCIDGLNIFPKVSPVVRMMAALGMITAKEADAFYNEAGRVMRLHDVEIELKQLNQKAERLGLKLVPDKK
jgi:hypothetical protein